MTRLLAILFAGCCACRAPEPSSVVLVASSLAGVVQPFVDARPGTRMISGASDALVWQLEQGAPAVVFLMADDQPLRLLGNRVVHSQIVVCDEVAIWAARPAEEGAAEDVVQNARRFGLADADVPLGRRTEDVLQRLDASEHVALADALRTREVSRDASARQLATRVRLGEIDAAIGYRSMAHRLDGVHFVALPEEARVSVAYHIVLLDDSPNSRLAYDALLQHFEEPERWGLWAPVDGRCEVGQ